MRIDISGQKFNRLLVLNYDHSDKYNTFWKCLCDCGKETIVRFGSIKSGHTKSCGCFKENARSGDIYGRLTLIEKMGIDRGGESIWKCLCSCGNEVIRRLGNLKSDNTLSCGCLRREKMKEIKTKEDSSFKHLIALYKNAARKRNLKFELTDDQFRALTKQNCYYCGIEPKQSNKPKHYSKEYIYNGVDRINSKEGYTLDNCVTSCVVCNRMKLDYTTEFWLSHIEKVLEFNRKRIKNESED